MITPQTMESNQTKQTERTNQTFAPIETNKRIGNKTIRPMGANGGTMNSLMQSTPNQQTVNKSTDTVSGQMNTLLNEDSDYLKYAKRTAMETSNRRGLLNSTIAAGAGVDAAMKSALPIAQQDAQTYNTANTNNTNWSNKFSENRQTTGLGMLRDKSQAGYAKDLEEMRFKNSQGLLNQEGQQRLEQMNAQSGYNNSEATHAGNITKELESLKAQNQAGLLTQEGQQRLEQLEAQSGFNKDEAAFQGDIAKELESLKAQNQSGLLSQEGQQRLEQLEAQQGFDIEIEKLRNENQSGLLTQEGAQRLEQLEAQATIASTRDAVLQGFDMEKLDAQQQNTVTNQVAQFAEIAKRDQQQIDAKFTSQFLESNSSLQSAWSQEVSSVYSNPNMTPAQQTKAIGEIKARYAGMMANNLATYQSMEGVNVNSSLFDTVASSGGTTVTGGGATTGGVSTTEGGFSGGTIGGVSNGREGLNIY